MDNSRGLASGRGKASEFLGFFESRDYATMSLMEKIRKTIIFGYDSTLNFFADTLSQTSSREGFIRYFKNTGWLFFGKMASMLAAFFVGAYIARYLGPGQYGLYSYALSFTGLFAVFASLGIDSILNRELVSRPEEKERLLGSSFVIKIFGSVFAIALISITLFLIKTDWTTSLLVLISSLSFIFNAFGVIDIYFQSQVLAKNTVKVQIISLIITSILKITLIFLRSPLVYFALAYLLDAFVLAIGFVVTYKKIGLGITKWKFDKKMAIMLVKNSWPLMFSGMAIAIYMKIDQVMIKNMIGDEAVGLYSVAAKVSEVWYFIPAIICASLFPAIVNAKKTSLVVYEKRLKNLYSLMFYISTLIAIPISLLSRFIIVYLFGAEYLGSISVLRIHIWAGVGVFLGYAIAQYLVTENLNKIYLKITIIGAVSNILLNLILIPIVGISGAAIATTISYTIVAFSVLLFKKSRKQGVLILKSILS